MKEKDPELMITSEVARALERAATTVIWYEKTGRLPAIRTETGVRLFSRTDVERLAAQRRRSQKGNK